VVGNLRGGNTDRLAVLIIPSGEDEPTACLEDARHLVQGRGFVGHECQSVDAHRPVECRVWTACVREIAELEPRATAESKLHGPAVSPCQWPLVQGQRQRATRRFRAPPTALVRRKHGPDLRRLCGTRPLLVIVEDIHWCDETSLEIFRYLSGRANAQPTASLLSRRADESAHALRYALTELKRSQVAIEVSLRMDESGTAAALRLH
jgi:hypothetical protein